MNIEMAYMLGMILGNGEIQQNATETTVTIDIPYKNLYTDDLKDVAVYVKASIVDIRSIVEPLIGHVLNITEAPHSTKMSFTKPNEECSKRNAETYWRWTSPFYYENECRTFFYYYRSKEGFIAWYRRCNRIYKKK